MADVDQDDDLDLIGAMDQSILVLHKRWIGDLRRTRDP